MKVAATPGEMSNLAHVLPEGPHEVGRRVFKVVSRIDLPLTRSMPSQSTTPRMLMTVPVGCFSSCRWNLMGPTRRAAKAKEIKGVGMRVQQVVGAASRTRQRTLLEARSLGQLPAKGSRGQLK